MVDVKELSIVIVSYNTAEMTVDCLTSLYEQTKVVNYQVIIYDNNSSDNSVTLIDAYIKDKPNMRLVVSTDNLGFSRANNVALEGLDTELFLLLNPDTLVLNSAVDHLVAFAKQYRENKIWGGRTLFGNKSLNTGNCFRKIGLWNLFCRASGLAAIFKRSNFFNSEEYGGWKRDSVREVDVVQGSFLLITSELWHQLNGFDLDFFMYGEESDLCMRAKQMGAQPVFTPTAEIVHYGGASEKVRADKIVRLLSARCLLIRKHKSGPTLLLCLWLQTLWPKSRLIAFSILCLLGRNKRESREIWEDICARKSEWFYGFNK